MNIQINIYKRLINFLNPLGIFKKYTPRFLLLALLFASLFSVSAFADSPEYAPEYWFQRLEDILPEAVFDHEVVESVEDVSRLVGLPYLLSLLYDSFTDKLPGLLGLLASFLGMALLGGMGGLFGDELKSDGVKKTVELVLSLALSLSLYQTVSPVLSRGLSAIEDITRFTSLFVPIMGGIYVAGGNYTAAATQSGALTWLVAELNALSGGVLSSLISASFAFALLGALGSGVDTSGLAKSLKQIFVVAMGVMATLFTGSLALQTTLSAAEDSVAMRTAKYAVGQMLPAVGSTISGTLSTVAVSMGLIKNAIGVGGIGVLLTLLLPPLLELYLVSVLLSLSKSFAGLLGFRMGEKLFSDFKSIFDMAVGVLAIAGVMLLLSLGIFMKTAVAVG